MPIKAIKTYSSQDLKIKAKSIPILDLISFTNSKKSQNYVMVNCPFHEDGRPSLVIYLRTNTFHCFGCSVTGDSIEFYKRLHNTDYITAIKEMIK